MFRRKWSGTEVLAVLTRYPTEGPTPLAAELGRSEDAVSGLARRYGRRTPRRPYRRTLRVQPRTSAP